MKLNFLSCLKSIIPVLFLLSSCSNNSLTTSYDGREFDISLNQDNSLILRCEKNNDGYSLTINGEGEGIDYQQKNNVPWNPIIRKVNNVVINEGITHIGDLYFNSAILDYYILPSSVNSVGQHTFNSSAIIYTYGADLNNIENDVYLYSENKPATPGNYFYIKDGVPYIYTYTVETLSFLFIGNSFTFRAGTEEHPAIPYNFQAIAQNLGQDVEIDFVVKSSHTLTKYADPNDEKGAIVEDKLTNNQYDYVILQEQSTAPINKYNDFLTAVKKLKNRIDQTQDNCQTILYETWGSPTGIEGTSFATVREMELALRDAYRSAGQASGCPVNYVGKAFTYAYENLDFSIYNADDNRHQNEYGAYLSAAVHVRSLFNLNVNNSSEYCSLDANRCKALLSIANQINNIS